MPTQHHHHSSTKHIRTTAVREKVGLQRVNLVICASAKCVCVVMFHMYDMFYSNSMDFHICSW